jgi:hypothetical protein
LREALRAITRSSPTRAATVPPLAALVADSPSRSLFAVPISHADHPQVGRQWRRRYPAANITSFTTHTPSACAHADHVSPSISRIGLQRRRPRARPMSAKGPYGRALDNSCPSKFRVHPRLLTNEPVGARADRRKPSVKHHQDR